MSFKDPQYFWWMIFVVLLILVLVIRAAGARKRQLTLLLGKAADDPDAVRLSPGRRNFRTFLLVIIIFLLICAAARPYWTSRMIPFSRQGRDIMVLCDVSKSMLASDIAPSRLEHAKFMLRELVTRDPQDRFGLAAFAGTAYTVCPLTSDPIAFEQYIDELSPELVPVGGTNLEQALDAAARSFKAAGGTNRAIVLFTDGDELEGDSSRILSELKKRNTPLFIIGLGDPQSGAPVPDGKGGFRRDEAGQLIMTKLAESKLIAAAEATGGMYIRSTVTDTGLQELERRIKKLDMSEQESGIRTIPVEKFPLALIAAAFFLLLYLMISERPRVKNLLLFLLPMLLLCGAAENPGISSKTVPPAVPQKEKLPESAAELYNLAREKQIAGNAEAVKLYEQVLKRSENHSDLQARSLFNLGTGVHRGGQESITGAVAQVQAQQLDPALAKLKEAEKRLKEAEDLYSGALSIPEAEVFRSQAAGNLLLLDADRKKIQDLKKKIEDLKKQQQKARNDAQKARDQQKQQNQQNQQNQQQAIDQAKQSARDLEKKADEMKQENLSRQAQKAQQELQRAEKETDKRKKEQHLDNAVKALGGDDSRKQDKSGKDNSKERKKEEKSGQQTLPQQPQQQKEEKAGDKDDKTSEQLLKMLKDEENQRRGELMKMRRMRRKPVQKDW